MLIKLVYVSDAAHFRELAGVVDCVRAAVTGVVKAGEKAL